MFREHFRDFSYLKLAEYQISIYIEMNEAFLRLGSSHVDYLKWLPPLVHEWKQMDMWKTRPLVYSAERQPGTTDGMQVTEEGDLDSLSGSVGDGSDMFFPKPRDVHLRPWGFI